MQLYMNTKNGLILSNRRWRVSALTLAALENSIVATAAEAKAHVQAEHITARETFLGLAD